MCNFLNTFIIINNAHEELQEKIHTLKTDYTNSQKELLENHVTYVIKFIDYYYKQNIDKKPLNEIKKDVVFAINNLKLSDNPNEYIFIYDFSGNVMEWTYDLSNWLGEDFFCMYGSTGDERVLRGGNMETNTLYSRTAFRNVEYSNISDASSSWQIIGFRLCRNVN